VADLPGLQLSASPAAAIAATYVNPNQRSFQVDPRLPSRPAGLVMDEESLDQLRAPNTAAAQLALAAGQQGLTPAGLQFVAGIVDLGDIAAAFETTIGLLKTRNNISFAYFFKIQINLEAGDMSVQCDCICTTVCKRSLHEAREALELYCSS
jgi:hypothetical protein